MTGPHRHRHRRSCSPPSYLDAGHVRHAYATTIHKAQGQTVDRAFVLGSDTLYQEAGYVALSRGRIENRIYLVDSEPRPEAHGREATATRTPRRPHPRARHQPRPTTRRRHRNRPRRDPTLARRADQRTQPRLRDIREGVPALTRVRRSRTLSPSAGMRWRNNMPGCEPRPRGSRAWHGAVGVTAADRAVRTSCREPGPRHSERLASSTRRSSPTA